MPELRAGRKWQALEERDGAKCAIGSGTKTKDSRSERSTRAILPTAFPRPLRSSALGYRRDLAHRLRRADRGCAEDRSALSGADQDTDLGRAFHRRPDSGLGPRLRQEHRTARSPRRSNRWRAARRASGSMDRNSAPVRGCGNRQEGATPHRSAQNGMMEQRIGSLMEKCAHRQRVARLAHTSRAIGD